VSGSLTAIFATALALSAVGTPVARRAALRLGIVDRPAARKLHRTPVPLLGGAAMLAAVLGALLLYPERRELVQLTWILAGAAWVSLWGLLDDRWGLSPSVKILAQTAAAGMVLLGGVRVDLPVPEAINVALTLAWFLGVTNAFNLLDNMDGLAGGVGAVAAFFFLVLAALNGQYLVGGLAAALLGACAGFLLHNFNPARIFMGDSGSMFLGFLMAALGIKLRFPDNVNTVTWMVPVLVLGIPILDTSLVVITRLRAGKNPFLTAGRDHLSHRLLALGWSCRRTALVLWVAGGLLGVAAVAVSLSSFVPAYAIALSAALLALVAGASVARLGPAPGPARDRSGEDRHSNE
jgi:UDP-GlcNAc:undecaprenyl-phosphate GlcNAc-1-phosphate transferase